MRLLAPLLLLPLLYSGCAGYRLGSMLPRDIRSVHVPIPRNLTEEPRLETELSNAVLAQLQRDGSLAITDGTTADATLHIEVTRLTLEPLSRDADNRARPNEYRILLDAQVELIRKRDGAALVRSGTLQGRSTFEFAGDLSSARRAALPAASEDLARHIVSAVTEAWTD